MNPHTATTPGHAVDDRDGAIKVAGRRAFGWRGPVATRWLYAGTGLLLLAYVGSRFVFEVVLHRPPVA